MKKTIALVFAIIIAVYQWINVAESDTSTSKNDVRTSEKEFAKSDAILQNAFDNRISDLQVQGTGTVIKVLPDDNKGSRHQKFILELLSGQTLVVAHNIDLAPRIASLREGDKVEFFGEYEWNSRGGVIHWTHHDPRGQHIGGWLKHKGEIYE